VTLLLRNLLFTVIVPGTVAVYLPLWIVQDRPAPSGPSLLVATALFTIGGCIYAWCVWDFAMFGRGTPAPIDAPKKLVVRGLYRYSRNPMYVGVLTVIFAQAALFRTPRLLLYALVVGTIFHLFIVLYEEPHLASEFAGEYEEYRARVGRWLPRRGEPMRSSE
jgi:protein-S-isoprenylcysteine O-methyltransferase Ste14